MSIDEAKKILPLPALLHSEGLGDRAKKSARCPFHDDKRNSFSIFKNGTGDFRWKCFAGCGAGDEITFLEKRKGISRSDATNLFIEIAGGGNGGAPVARSTTAVVFDWQSCVRAFTNKHVEEIAEWRGLSPSFVRELRDTEQIGIYRDRIAFPVINDGKIVGAHFRLENGDWNYAPTGIKAAPLVFGELTPGERVQLFESTWDGLDYLDKSGECDGVIITRGSGNGKLGAALIPQGSPAYIWTQNDSAGERWQQDICAHTKATVKRVRIPAPHKDLNDWTRAGATSDNLLGSMLKAEVVHEAEKSWIDALNEAVVTSNELRDLHLTPRKKLLGDWFCEGDLGFIFAYRGVGKTWFALAIAQALSTGGKLGDWQAHAPVKVLYIMAKCHRT